MTWPYECEVFHSIDASGQLVNNKVMGLQEHLSSSNYYFPSRNVYVLFFVCISVGRLSELHYGIG